MLNSIIKDLKVNILDGRQMLIIIAMPVILTVILSFALGSTFSSGGLANPVDTAVVKLYDPDMSRDEILAGIEGLNGMPPQALEAYKAQMGALSPEEIFFDGFLELEGIRGIISYRVMTGEEARQALDDLEVSAIIYMPEDFITSVYSNMFGHKAQTEFEIVADASTSYSGDIVRQALTAFTDSLSMSFANMEVYSKLGENYLSRQELFQRTGLFHENLEKLVSDSYHEIKTESVDQYALIDSITYYTAAMLCMFMLFSAGIGGRSMLEEKENLTYSRMKVLGVTYFQMMVSKMAVVFLICLLQTVVMIGLSAVVFSVDWGNYFSVAIIALTGSFAIGGLGSFIGAISLRSGNYKVANAFEGAIVQILALFGGSYIPLSVMPKFFSGVSRFTVNGQALSAYIKTAQGMPFGNITSELLTVLVFGVVFLAAAWVLVSSEGRKENA